ncbi:ATP-binding protein [Aeropyrum camini]|uniref:Predicted ATPase of the PP-loop superfamily n=1 Tax=Aeropyrum camini SY1 = JCM 12091 TaxID=1198449 RepID=U3THG3_9CREN|nr:ATP-binding protein [Aeropyrum camini]BAN90774.1 predicted ATPase of the PP-loop superfamily [Aeropyrum camini SY1 = JCM 12091]
MARCSVCGAPAVAYIRYQKRYMCRDHYLEFVESKVERAILRHRLVRRGQRVLAAVSGGKDSSTLLAVLSRLSGKLGFELVALYIHLGIYDYSEKSREASLRLARQLNVPLIVFDLKEVLGAGIPELARASKRPPCSVCGMVKRYVINAAAVELAADAVALGHNADDIAVYNLKSFLNQDLEAISKLGVRTESIPGVAVGRIRPLYYVYEKESFLYSLLAGLPFLHEECPFVDRRQMEVELKETVNQLEDKRPGLKLQMVSKLAKRVEDYPKPGGSIGRCPSCGLLSSGGECSFCRVTRRALGRPMGPVVREWFRRRAEELGLGASRRSSLS